MIVKQSKIIKQAEEIVRDAGLTPKAINLKVLVPLLDNCVLEEDDSALNVKWAGLLATAATTENFERFGYPTILTQLSPKEVQFLDAAYEEVKKNLPREKWLTHGFKSEIICKILVISQEEYEVMADNLFRLDLFQTAGTTGVTLGNKPLALRSYEIICLTPMGFDFVRACRGPTDFEPKTITEIQTERTNPVPPGPAVLS